MKRLTGICLAAAVAVAPGVAAIAGVAGASAPVRPGLEGTVWVGNRGFPAVAAYDASSGSLRHAVALATRASDVAAGKGKIYVGEESANTIAVIDGRSGQVIKRIATGPRPHHLAGSVGGNYVTYSAFGTNRAGVIDVRTDELVGEWEASASPLARTHASALSTDARTMYAANEGTNEITAVDTQTGELLYSIPVPRAHELIVTADGRTAYVACRSDNAIRVVDLQQRTIVAELALSLPDTLQLSRNGKQLTVGLRGTPAQVAVVDTDSLAVTAVVTIPGTLAGHQWTSPNGRWTFAAFEGPAPGTAVIDHELNEVVDVLPFPGGGQPHGIDYAGPQAG